ncbi:hypothetical protein [Fulvivirga lutea]|uniref:Universal stress protein n=1 Tax=Fulvivirga lutea TaxID=2810512 RepID=A0A974WES7_9BACT|nr:hypothetical protein [Fulvivirga lutea]QSE96319.1 hypothetical protein JR347_11940 [Fulvivirga lutea]
MTKIIKCIDHFNRIWTEDQFILHWRADRMLKKKALYPINLKEDTTYCLNKAVELCEKNNWELIILYAYRLIKPYNEGDGTSQSFKKEIENKAKFIFDKIEVDLLKSKGIDYRFLSEVGFMADRIKINIKTQDIDYLILCPSMQESLKNEIHEEFLGKASVQLVA